MTISVTLSRICGASVLALAALAMPAQAREDQPVTDDSIGAMEVATTPLTDLNLASDDIPELLLTAQADPYARVNSCSTIMLEVRRLDRVLGEDYDIADWSKRKLQAGRVAQSVLGSFIPFRGVIREVSGANDTERKLRDAISAGYMRRAYLKGRGEASGCHYPARPATDEIRALAEAERIEEKGG